MRQRRPTQEKDFPVIYSSNIAEADLLKCLLNGEGIQAVLEDEYIGTIAPYTASAGGVGAVKVHVANSDVREARLIVEEFVNTAQRDDINDRSKPLAGE